MRAWSFFTVITKRNFSVLFPRVIAQGLSELIQYMAALDLPLFQ